MKLSPRSSSPNELDSLLASHFEDSPLQPNHKYQYSTVSTTRIPVKRNSSLPSDSIVGHHHLRPADISDSAIIPDPENYLTSGETFGHRSQNTATSGSRRSIMNGPRHSAGKSLPVRPPLSSSIIGSSRISNGYSLSQRGGSGRGLTRHHDWGEVSSGVHDPEFHPKLTSTLTTSKVLVIPWNAFLCVLHWKWSRFTLHVALFPDSPLLCERGVWGQG